MAALKNMAFEEDFETDSQKTIAGAGCSLNRSLCEVWTVFQNHLDLTAVRLLLTFTSAE
jgi:hypothetical protein